MFDSFLEGLPTLKIKLLVAIAVKDDCVVFRYLYLSGIAQHANVGILESYTDFLADDSGSRKYSNIVK